MKNDVPRTISFLSVPDLQEEDEDPLHFDDDTGFIGVEYQAPSKSQSKHNEIQNAFSWIRSGRSRTTQIENFENDYNPQGDNREGNVSPSRKKGFGLFRPLSRKRGCSELPCIPFFQLHIRAPLEF